MIHYIKMTSGVRYSLAGVTHAEAEALARDLSPSASVFGFCGRLCTRSGPLDPYGADGCTCAPIDGPMDIWRLADGCVFHGAVQPDPNGPITTELADYLTGRGVVGVGIVPSLTQAMGEAIAKAFMEGDDHPNGFLCRRHGVDDCFCSGPPDYTIALASRPGSPEWFAEERARRDATSEMDDPDDIEFDDCTSGDMETWLNCLCTTDTGCQPDAPGEPLARDATCTGPCKANPMDCPGPDADGTCREVPALLSKGRVGCRWCSWHSEYTDEVTGYRLLRDHWASDDCPGEPSFDELRDAVDEGGRNYRDTSSEPRLLGTGYRTTTEKRDSVVQPTGAGCEFARRIGPWEWLYTRSELACWISVRCEIVARRLVRAVAGQPRRRS